MAKEKILIVDDEPMIRWTLNEALRGWEYDTVEAGTVAGALALFEDRPAAGCSTSTCRTVLDLMRCARSRNASRKPS